MSRTPSSFGRLALPVLVGLAMLACGPQSRVDPAQLLQASVASNWQSYKQDHGLPGGGLAIYLETPRGNYFASAGMPAGVTPNHHFRMASNTKTFTAAAILLLAQQGRLRLDDTIVSTIPGQATPYVPDTAQYAIPFKAAITIRQLLSHTAGVFDITNEVVPLTCPVPYAGQCYPLYVLATDPNHAFSPAELVGVNATNQLSYFVPGADFRYSNTGYSVLATILERVSGLPYDQFLLQNLITPNGLGATSVPMLPTDRTLPEPFTPGYLWAHGLLRDVTNDNMSMNIAEGNIISTPVDLARWVKRLVRAEAGPNAVSVQAMMATTSQSKQSYGLGLVNAGSLGYGHTGAHNGYLSLMVYDASMDVTLVLYFNVWDDANLATDQFTLMVKAAKDARAALGY
ncbi:MAG: beta-lactamase family protein [Holophagaceae bacterium]|nr:beta-lactamase family protein [Holophagaceae bacterium]